MNAAQWAQRFAAARRPSLATQVQTGYTRALVKAGRRRPSAQAPSSILVPGLHRGLRALPANAKHANVSAVAGMVGGAGYTHSTAPGSQEHFTHTMGRGYQ